MNNLDETKDAKAKNKEISILYATEEMLLFNGIHVVTINHGKNYPISQFVSCPSLESVVPLMAETC